jgi:hypothetical protein
MSVSDQTVTVLLQKVEGVTWMSFAMKLNEFFCG